ncbi:hypothetical protein [Candidatus Burkholderia verschuerenii]|uniref:hypothetical protein n=1 Tax=Candidatus Burkholderia verschuerenii TaxID=242163 RepID=UPI000AF5F505|nr:hypothetical protein [Candidatus Burkholderia verschuerenii]
MNNEYQGGSSNKGLLVLFWLYVLIPLGVGRDQYDHTGREAVSLMLSRCGVDSASTQKTRRESEAFACSRRAIQGAHRRALLSDLSPSA